MTTLTSSSTFTIIESPPTTESLVIPILPALGSGEGTGRLIHPVLGTYDYALQPTKWRNVDADVVVPPIWQSTMTLGGFANTLWAGTIRDVVVQELWPDTGGLSMSIEQFRMMLAMWQNPPDPSVGYVQWFPSYCSDFGFNVVMLELSNSGSDIELDVFSLSGYVSAPVTLKMRIASRV